jgi:hypothetical protein
MRVRTYELNEDQPLRGADVQARGDGRHLVHEHESGQKLFAVVESGNIVRYENEGATSDVEFVIIRRPQAADKPGGGGGGGGSGRFQCFYCICDDKQCVCYPVECPVRV